MPDGRPRAGPDGSPRSSAADGGRADGHTAGLVLVPTRELAIQVAEAIHRYGERLGTRVLPIYGGQPIGQQLRAAAARR